MPKSSVNASLSSYDDIFSTEESRQEEQREQVRQIPIGELFPFKNHPFKVLDDDSMSDTVESVKQYGVLSPLIARPRPKGGYEIISGHRRQHAAELAGLETLPVIVRQMDDDAAIILMVDVVTVTDEETGALTPEGNLTLVDDYHTNYSDGSGQQFITLVSKSGATFYLVIDRNAKGQQTVHFMNLVDEADLLTLMEEDAADAYTAEKEAAAQAEQDKLKAEEEAKKAAEEAAASGTEQTGGNKVTKYAATFLGVLALVGLAAGGGIYTFMKQKQKKQAEKEALDPDANYTEDKGNFEIPVEDEPEETGEEDKAEE